MSTDNLTELARHLFDDPEARAAFLSKAGALIEAFGPGALAYWQCAEILRDQPQPAEFADAGPQRTAGAL